MCGEQSQPVRLLPLTPGSPPRVRGTVSGFPVFSICNRITPACAGNRASSRTNVVRVWDHPRVCGEQPCPQRFLTSNKGSPPRVRGTEDGMQDMINKDRITPACAGNRKPLPPNRANSRDHPRVCGEQWMMFPWHSLWSGSPPRVRGTACDRHPD